MIIVKSVSLSVLISACLFLFQIIDLFFLEANPDIRKSRHKEDIYVCLSKIGYFNE